jgi:nucleotide-binding universal stress UspA family protein
MSTIVVGLDGSEGCVNALRFAIEEARARGLGIRAVSAWHVPIMAYGAADGTAAFVPGPVGTGEYEKLTAEALTRVLEEVDAKAAGVEVTRVVREGHPAEVLLEEAKTADMLVVGSRGRGGFASLLLGSVSQHVAHHACCPVVIVPRRARTD